MNILHLKYAVEVAKTRSISKAAENLYMGQPNLSRAIKELEESLGITIFRLTTKGISITPDGEEFLQYARQIVQKVEEVEQIYQNGRQKKQTFSVSVPRASYLSFAMADFSRCMKKGSPAEFYYCETNPMNTINSVVREDFNLGIVRFQSSYEKYFSDLFKDKKLTSNTIAEFSYSMIISKNDPLANKDSVCLDDLADYIEVCHSDPYVPSVPAIDVRKSELTEFVERRIFVYERGTQFVLLGNVPETFMWVSPVPQQLLDSYGLVQLKVRGAERLYKDVLIYRRDYRLSDYDKEFIAAVHRAKFKYNVI